MKKAFKIIDTFLFSCILAVALGLCVMIFFFHIKPVVVVSGSMEPEIPVGSLVFIDQRDQSVDPGDVIAYQIGDTTIVHRVVDQNDDGTYITKGDSNDTADPASVTKQQIVGKEIFCVHKAGKFRFICSKAGLLIIGAVAIGYFIFGMIWKKRVT